MTLERCPEERLGGGRLGPRIDERLHVTAAICPPRHKTPRRPDDGVRVIMQDRELGLGRGRVIRRPYKLRGELRVEALFQGLCLGKHGVSAAHTVSSRHVDSLYCTFVQYTVLSQHDTTSWAAIRAFSVRRWRMPS